MAKASTEMQMRTPIPDQRNSIQSQRPPLLSLSWNSVKNFVTAVSQKEILYISETFAQRLRFLGMKPNIHDFQDYRVYLKEVLASRRKLNKDFSLRAWARNVGVPPSTFSEVLNGRRHLPMNIASKVARTLGLSNQEQMHFLLVVMANQSSDVELLNYLKKLLALSESQKTDETPEKLQTEIGVASSGPI